MSSRGDATSESAAAPDPQAEPDPIYGMTPYDVVHELLKVTMVTHHETVDLVQDVPLPIDLGGTWVARLAQRALDSIGAVPGVETARALATVAYDVTRELHRHLCGDPDRESCRADTKTAADLIRLLAPVLLRCDICAALHHLTATHLEASGLSRNEVINAVEAVLKTALCAISDNQNPMDDVGNAPVVQLNTAVSNVGDADYLQMRSLTTQIRPTIEECGYRVEITSDYATPANRDGFVDEGRVRGRIYRSSAIVIFSRGAGDGSSATWTLAGELNIPTLVLRSPEDLHAAARFPGQMDARELHTYQNADDVVRLIGDFLSKHRGRISHRDSYLRRLHDLSTEHLARRMTLIDTDAFDNSMVTWERARFYTSSPVLWFQAHPSTSDEIRRVLGLRGALTDPFDPGSANSDAVDNGRLATPPGAEAAPQDPANRRAVGETDRSRSEREDAALVRGDPLHSPNQPNPSTGDRTRLGVQSFVKLLLAAESAGVDVAELHEVIEEWQRPGVLAAVSPRTSEPDFDGWVSIIQRLTGR